MERIRGDQYQGEIIIGQRVSWRDFGIVIAVHGRENPGSVRHLAGGVCSMGGEAEYDIAFNTHITRHLPECILRGLGWGIYPGEIATPEEIAATVAAAGAHQKSEVEGKARMAEEKAAEITSLPSRFPFLEVLPAGSYKGRTVGAGNIKKELALSFPGVKFSVKSESFSGGNAIRVSWTDGPTEEQVSKKIGKYQEGSFNPCDDLYSYSGAAWTEVFGGAKYVTRSRYTSWDLVKRVASEMGFELEEENIGSYGEILGLTQDQSQTIYRAARQTSAEIAGKEISNYGNA
jgi:hypothetical protein